ncbi:hypothetical protein ACEQPO_24975 [Bacillus sp. SL00103]
MIHVKDWIKTYRHHPVFEDLHIQIKTSKNKFPSWGRMDPEKQLYEMLTSARTL